MTRQGFLIGFLAGGWLATLAVLAVLHLGGVNLGSMNLGSMELRSARAEDPPTGPPVIPLPFGPGGPPGTGPTVNPSGGSQAPRGLVDAGLGTSDSNRRSIALSASIGSGQSVVYYFDTVAQRLCVYQYQPGNRGGLRLLAARLIDFDLKLEAYRDVSEKTPREMRQAYEAAMAEESRQKGGSGALPTKRVDLPGGLK